jgi:predicted metalloprotease with PDZ domain
VRPYTRDDVIATLNSLVHFDWAGLFKARVDDVAPEAPLNGLTNSGWRLVYNAEPNQAVQDTDVRRKQMDLRFSLGLTIATDKKNMGHLKDVIVDSPAARTGLAPGMKILAVNGRSFTPDRLREAIAEAHDSERPIELLTVRDEVHRTYLINYHQGERYPHLERIAATADTLSDILRPHAQPAPMASQ